jgi:ferredoxin
MLKKEPDNNIKTKSEPSVHYPPFTINVNSLETLITELKKSGYITVSPVFRDGAIIYDEINKADEMPIGLTDEQEKAYYRVKQYKKKTYFHYTVGPYSWKKFLFPPSLKLWRAEKNGKSFNISVSDSVNQKYAFIGVRSCELNAIFIQDKVFNNGQFSDSVYNTLRAKTFIVAVNCTKANSTCFCVSMNSGPKVKAGYDIALTEVFDDEEHFFLIQAGSTKGLEMIKKLKTKQADETEILKAEKSVKKTASSMKRSIDNNGIKELLYSSSNSLYWDEIAIRCLTCANCTLVCPTCFCNNIEDTTDLTGEHAERWRKWDSCFTMDFAKVAGGNFRSSPKARYRQWMTHKLASWIDQFDTSGCVGCGRCITWCPVKIDITEEVAAFRKLSELTKIKKL